MAMRKMLIGLVALGGLSLVGGLATNAAADTRVDQRQHLQQQRIRNGLAAGRLTREEARFLMREQNQIARMEHRAEGDGRLTGWERAQIERAQDAASRDIQRLARNDDYRNHDYRGRFGQYR
jgi:hypothetical protein